MKKITLLFFVTAIAIACKQNPQKEKTTIIKTNYPEALQKIFEKHGSIENWKKMSVLSFTKGDEVHTTDLHTRKSLIKSPKYSIGFDGEKAWLSQKDTTAFKSKPEFYYNLYFYFYTMPFVLADEGIVYSETKPISFEGVDYPGIKISYNNGVGASPEDNYFLYYNPKTYQMEWLGYTMTYFSQKESKAISLIRYNDWVNVEDFLLPNSLTWYKKGGNGNPISPARPAVEFTNITVSQTSLKYSFFNKPIE